MSAAGTSVLPSRMIIVTGLVSGKNDNARATVPLGAVPTLAMKNIGLAAEFPFARAFIEGLGPPASVSFVPGNHDAYVRGSLPYLARAFAPQGLTTSAGVALSSSPSRYSFAVCCFRPGQSTRSS